MLLLHFPIASTGLQYALCEMDADRTPAPDEEEDADVAAAAGEEDTDGSDVAWRDQEAYADWDSWR